MATPIFDATAGRWSVPPAARRDPPAPPVLPPPGDEKAFARRQAVAIAHGMHLGRAQMGPWIVAALGLGFLLGGAVALAVLRLPAVLATLGAGGV